MTKYGRNDPCPCGSGKKYKHCCLVKDDNPFELAGVSAAEPVIMDRRVMERHHTMLRRLAHEHSGESDEAFSDLVNEMNATQTWPTFEPRTPLERAQQIMFDAFEARGSRRIRLARQALEVSPDCADAYVLLAQETARSSREALPLYEKGLAAGERALGPNAKEEFEELFWTDVLTRPYMRARFGLAEALADLGRIDEAIAHYQGLLELNPGDNQGVRYPLLTNLLLAKRDDEACALLRLYPDETTAAWAYGRALVKFRREGASLFAGRAFGAAIKTNPSVPGYLLGVIPFPDQMPPYMGIGDQTEAIWFVADQGKAWLETRGAIEWMTKLLAAGPEELTKQLRGAGHAFFFNPYDTWAVSSCPLCDRLTKIRKRHLAVLIEPDHLISIYLTCRMCDDCDLIVVHQRDAFGPMREAAAARGWELTDEDVVVLGVVDRTEFNRRPAETNERTWLLSQVQRFREELYFNYLPAGWYPSSMFDEVDEPIDAPGVIVDARSSLMASGTM